MSLLLRFGPGKAGAGSGRDRDIHNARNDRRRLRLHSLLVRNGDGLLASLVQRRAACAEYVERAFLQLSSQTYLNLVLSLGITASNAF